MVFNRRLTGALAWGGLILILAVPSAEMLSAKVDPNGTTPKAPAKTDAVQTASVAKSGDPVKDFEAGGQPLPSYISDAPAAPAPRRVLPATGTVAPTPKPKAATGTPSRPAQTETAALPAPVAPETAPVPMPAHKRPLPAAQTAAVQPTVSPRPVTVTQPSTVTLPAPAPAPVAAPSQTATAQPAPAEAPIVLDEDKVLAREANAEPAIVPPADIPEPPRVVGEDELQDWDSGSLADYLQRRGLMSDASYPAVQSDEQSSAVYEEDDGTFLKERPRRVRRNADDSFVIFSND